MRFYIVYIGIITSLLFYSALCSGLFNVCTPNSGVLTTMYGVSLIECATNCKSSGSCLSVNINHRIKKCDVLSVILSPSTINTCSGWMYIDVDFIRLLTNMYSYPNQITQELNNLSVTTFFLLKIDILNWRT